MTNSATAMTLVPYDLNAIYVLQDKVEPKYHDRFEDRYPNEQDIEDFVNDCKQIFEWMKNRGKIRSHFQFTFPLPYDIEGHTIR